MQHVGEPWVSVQMWADPLISSGPFNFKHSGSWQELRAEPASTLTSWSELCLWILLPLGTQWLYWDLPGCGNLQARAGQQQWALVKRRNWGKNLVPFSGKGAFKQHTKSIFSEPWKTWVTRGHDFSLQALSLALLLCLLPCHAGDVFFKLYPLHFCFLWSPCLSA